MNQPKRIAVLGSTGSIGTQTLDIVSRFPEKFRVDLLTARNNYKLLANQARFFKPRTVVIANKDHFRNLSSLLKDTDIRILAGQEAISAACSESDADIVVTAMVGYSGLLPTIAAINTGKNIALANKETLVVAGSIITDLAKRNNVKILPVDSEHSAIFQCLQGEEGNPIQRIILTASGGPFRNTPAHLLPRMTKEDALQHPNWSMGPKVTIDSASMMNKGFEMIEAKWLFDVSADDIEIVVHPQSIVHSMVSFEDGSVKAQLGIPDMHTPISYALSYPDRLLNPDSILSLDKFANLSFERPDTDKFPMLTLAFEAVRSGGNLPCILNAANEIAVEAFLSDNIRFTDIPEIASKTMQRVTFLNDITIPDLMLTDKEARIIASEIITEKSIL